MVYVHETASASVSGFGNSRGSITTTVSDGGIGTEVGPTYTASGPEAQSISDSISGDKWEREDSSGGTFSVSASLGVSATMSMPSDSVMYNPPLSYVAAQPSCAFDAGVSGHTIITSPIETSYFKDDNPETLGHDPHIRNLDGSIQVASGVGYDYPLGWTVVGLPLWANKPFDPSVSAYQWTVGGGGAFLAGYSTGNPVATLGLAQSSVAAFPTTSNVSVKVTNTGMGGGQDSNTYAITWHAPFESNAYIGSVKTKSLMENVLHNIEPDGTHGTDYAPAGKLDLGGAIDAIAVGIKMYNPEAETATGLAELLGHIAGFTKWEYDYQEQETVSYTNGPQTWVDAVQDQSEPYTGPPNIPPALTDDVSNYKWCDLNVWRVALNNDESWYADGYNLNGFDGNTQHVVKSHKIDGVHLEFFFTWADDSTGKNPGQGSGVGGVPGGPGVGEGPGGAG